MNVPSSCLVLLSGMRVVIYGQVAVWQDDGVPSWFAGSFPFVVDPKEHAYFDGLFAVVILAQDEVKSFTKPELLLEAPEPEPQSAQPHLELSVSRGVGFRLSPAQESFGTVNTA